MGIAKAPDNKNSPKTAAKNRNRKRLDDQLKFLNFKENIGISDTIKKHIKTISGINNFKSNKNREFSLNTP